MPNENVPENQIIHKIAPDHSHYDLGNNTVVFGNDIIRASQKLNLSEKRIMVAAASKLSPRMKVFPKNGIRLTAQEYAETFDLDMTTAYEQMEAAGNALFEREWSYLSGKLRVRRRWVHEIVYHKGQGWLEIHFAPKIAPYLLNLTNNFTKYKLQQASAYRSVYTWRMMECFVRFIDAETGKGVWNISIDDYHDLMETPPSLRQNFAALKRRVIEPALAELKTDWSVQFVAKKRGRKFESLQFKYVNQPQGNLDL